MKRSEEIEKRESITNAIKLGKKNEKIMKIFLFILLQSIVKSLFNYMVDIGALFIFIYNCNCNVIGKFSFSLFTYSCIMKLGIAPMAMPTKQNCYYYNKTQACNKQNRELRQSNY